MNDLITKPNILFLIAIRSPEVYFKSLIINRLRRPIYRINLLNALTFISEDLVDGDEIPILQNNVLEAITYRVNDKLHNEKGPAVINEHICEICDIMQEYYFINGKLHNTNGPAIVCTDNSDECDGEVPYTKHEYYVNGLLHNDNDAARIEGHIAYKENTAGLLNYYGVWDCDDETHVYKKKYYKHGKKHRDHNDLPATIKIRNGESIKRWYYNGRPYREKGPTEVVIDGTYKRESWHSYELSDVDNKVLHREDGPASIVTDGEIIIEEWFIDGQLHREGDKPAYIELFDGTIMKMLWYQNGKLHRENGPAVRKYKGIMFDEEWNEEWWLNGEEVDGF